MRAVARISLIVFALAAAAVNARAQAPDQGAKEGTAVVAGRVTANGKPAQGFAVLLSRVEPRRDPNLMTTFQREPPLKAMTDYDGRYRFAGLRAGRYTVSPLAPAHITKRSAAGSEVPRVLSLADGETIEDVDFALERGGVITGRVTKADGRPVIGEMVALTQAADDNKAGPKVDSIKEDQEEDEDEDEDDVDEGGHDSFYDPTTNRVDIKTDDRGYYRIYGLAPGRYLVSIGTSGGPLQAARSYHETTYHPGVTDMAKANPIEVTPGGVSVADIKLGTPSLTYRASGRVIEAETGKPIANAIIMSMSTSSDSSGAAMSRTTQTGLSNDKGEFRIDNVMPGKHSAIATLGLDGQSDLYADKVDFEIKGGDVTGLVIKAHRGLVVSGVAVVEGASEAAAADALSQTELFAYTMSEDTQGPSYGRSKVNPDGTFQLRGLRPGKAQIIVRPFPTERKLVLTRIERGGIEQKEFVELAPGQQVTDLRVVLTYASASIRGQVKVEGGTIEKGAYLMVAAYNADQHNGPAGHESEVDANGQFVFEGLIPGEYRLTLTLVSPPSKRNGGPQTVNQNVTVTANAETQVTLVLDLSQKGRDR